MQMIADRTFPDVQTKNANRVRHGPAHQFRSKYPPHDVVRLRNSCNNVKKDSNERAKAKSGCIFFNRLKPIGFILNDRKVALPFRLPG